MTSAVHTVKEELRHIRPPRRCCRLAELSTLLHMEGTYRIRGGGEHSLVTESSAAGTARRIYTLLHSLFELNTPVVKVERTSPRRGSVYALEIPAQNGFQQVLNELGVLDSSLAPEAVVPGRLIRNDCCVAAALRGAFLGGGYISEPYGRADFEIAFSTREGAQSFHELMARRSLSAGMRARRNQWALYLKSRQQISDFLAIVGAHHAHLEWESQTIINATKNEVNRLVNCDAANARRLADASHRQREVLARLEELGLLGTLEPGLVELAEARRDNPQASLAELGATLVPPVSKSVVQGRMRRLEALLERETGAGGTR